MVHIFVPKYTAKPRFKAHYNSATGKYYSTSKEFVADLNSKGLELCKQPTDIGEKRTAYKPSRWARGMVESIRDGKQKDGSVKVGDKFRDELHKRGAQLPGEREK